MRIHKPKLEKKDSLSIWRSLEEKCLEHKSEAIADISFKSDPYFPVEFLKEDPARFFKAQEAHRTFLSSGTSSDKKSKSMFSNDGLELYKASAFLSFMPVYNSFFKDQKRKCISFIPSTSQWENSSLAQMISWFGDEFELIYVETKQELENELDGDPIWIFATGFHLVNFFDDDNRVELPRGSVVFETGGTKGRSRSVTRQELYSMICEIFSISRNYIVSEYSMSELSSQSWDYVEADIRDNKEVALEQRSFRFPSWVKCSVLNNRAEHASSGYGALLVDDPLRIDFPQPFRIQDMVELHENGSFKLRSRMPGAALKGCSLNVEDEQLSHSISRKRAVNEVADNFDLLDERIAEVLNTFIPFLDSKVLEEAFVAEFADSRIAFEAMQDIISGLPKTKDELRDLAYSLKSETRKKSWLLILSSTHSQLCIYPILLAYILGIDLSVRKSEKRAGNAEKLILDKFQVLRYSKLRVLDQSFRINGNSSLKDFDAIMLFSNDDTAHSIDQLVDIPLQSFSSVVCGSIYSEGQDIDLLLKDIMSLATKGCMSAKLVKTNDADILAKILDASLRYEALNDLSGLEAFRIKLELKNVRYKMNDRLLVALVQDKKIYEELILEAPYNVVLVAALDTDIKLDLVSSLDVALGSLNAPKFDAKHFSQYYYEV